MVYNVNGVTLMMVFMVMMVVSLLLCILMYLVNISHNLDKIAWNRDIEEAERDRKAKKAMYKAWGICFVCSLAVTLLVMFYR